jgi:hypothetical protein
MTPHERRQKIIELVMMDEEYERRRCKEDFTHFCEAWCQIEKKVAGEDGGSIPFRLWPAQRAVIPDLLTAMMLIILKARQLGLTWLCAAYCLWLITFYPGKLVVVVSAIEDWAVEFIDRMRFIRQRLPAMFSVDLEKDGAQHIRVVHSRKADGSVLDYSEVKSLATTLAGAQGKTPDVMIMDETSRNRYAASIFGSSWPGIEKAGGRIIVISNSHKDGVGWGWTRSIYRASMAGLNQWTRIFLPWWACPERITDAEAAAMERDPSVVPVDFRERMLATGYDEVKFSENYPESESEAVSAAIGSYFGKILLRHSHPLQGHVGNLIPSRDRKDVEFQRRDDGLLEIWRYPYRLVDGYDGRPWTERYCIGSDISEGLGQSYSVAYVMDRHTRELVARLRGNRVDAHTWASMLANLSQYYRYGGMVWGVDEWAVICAEITGAGQTTVKALKDFEHTNLYRQQIPAQVGKEISYRYGWNETKAAKKQLSQDLLNYLRVDAPRSVFCETLIDECSTWIRHENGTVGPEDDTRLGDCVIAAGCTLQADSYMDGLPKRVDPPVEGWRVRYNVVPRQRRTKWVA